jgi:RHS repeat-associated protein
LDAAGVINMNGRIYDPYTGSFFSPDPYITYPSDWLNYNRYSYAMGNPFLYTDPDGEIFGTIVTFLYDLVKTTFFNGGLDPTSSNARDKAWSNFDPTRNGSLTNNAWRIDMGLFQSDPNKNWFERYLQVLSRFTWEIPQTLVGYLYTHTRNVTENVDRVDYFGGATFATNEYSKNHNGITFGGYINMNIKDKITGDFENWVINDPMYMHEYGHTIDSRAFGLSYLYAIGIPSGFSALGNKEIPNDPNGLWTHDVYWTEMRANRRAAKYFGKHYGVNWDYTSNTSSLFWGYPLNY